MQCHTRAASTVVSLAILSCQTSAVDDDKRLTELRPDTANQTATWTPKFRKHPRSTMINDQRNFAQTLLTKQQPGHRQKGKAYQCDIMLRMHASLASIPCSLGRRDGARVAVWLAVFGRSSVGR